MIPSLQKRMLVSVMIGMTAVLVLFDGVLYFTIRASLLRQIKEGLSITAELLAASVEINERGLDLEMAFEQLPDFHDPHQPLFFQIADARGRIVATSPNLDRSGIDLSRPSSRIPVFADCLVRGHPALALTFQFLPRTEDAHETEAFTPIQVEPYVLAVARESGAFLGQLSRLRWIMTLVSSVALILSVAIAWMVVRQGLQPLHTVAGQIAAITVTDLSPRLQRDRIPRELSPIVERLNDLLGRLQEAFAHERRFTADVAHELRTPLAGLRSVLDVSLSRTREVTEYRGALLECSSIAMAMQAMVENLLTLARLQAGSVELNTRTFPLVPLVERRWSAFASEAQQRHLTFTHRIDPAFRLESDSDYLAMILTNLFSNAAQYTNPNGQITVTTSQDQGRARITVANTGCTLTPDQVEHVFDPFWRADAARAATGQHCGLGLALVRQLVETLGGSVSADVQDARFTVQMDGLKYVG